MADAAAHAVDQALPNAPVRQWVLSFPFHVRFSLASSPQLCAAVGDQGLRRLAHLELAPGASAHLKTDGPLAPAQPRR